MKGNYTYHQVKCETKWLKNLTYNKLDYALNQEASALSESFACVTSC